LCIPAYGHDFCPPVPIVFQLGMSPFPIFIHSSSQPVSPLSPHLTYAFFFFLFFFFFFFIFFFFFFSSTTDYWYDSHCCTLTQLPLVWGSPGMRLTSHWTDPVAGHPCLLGLTSILSPLLRHSMVIPYSRPSPQYSPPHHFTPPPPPRRPSLVFGMRLIPFGLLSCLHRTLYKILFYFPFPNYLHL